MWNVTNGVRLRIRFRTCRLTPNYADESSKHTTRNGRHDMDSISMMAGFMSTAAVFFFTDSNYIKTRMVYGISYICKEVKPNKAAA